MLLGALPVPCVLLVRIVSFRASLLALAVFLGDIAVDWGLSSAPYVGLANLVRMALQFVRIVPAASSRA